ncbi:hypothetical protein HK100_012844 [Physocladia obscura]|uniref:Uncharacterized protein n=1 Tax=Physocladia obscura TaxID=109957 RepID=A0AAD5T538_9FUNG|nr:hypothetical protein HK100_012844 [Physocladia obscura]
MRRTTSAKGHAITSSANNETNLDADNIEAVGEIQEAGFELGKINAKLKGRNTRKNSDASTKSQVYSHSRSAVDLRDLEDVDGGRHGFGAAVGTGTTIGSSRATSQSALATMPHPSLSPNPDSNSETNNLNQDRNFIFHTLPKSQPQPTVLNPSRSTKRFYSYSSLSVLSAAPDKKSVIVGGKDGLLATNIPSKHNH